MTSLLDKHDPFYKWTESRGGHISPYIDLFHKFPNGRRGIVATYPLKKGELLLLIPVKACIHTLAQEDDEVRNIPATSSSSWICIVRSA
jgi:hypothetical protein